MTQDREPGPQTAPKLHGADAAEPRAARAQVEAPDPDLASAETRRERYLELVLDQLWRLERAVGGLGPSRDGAGILAAAALADAGRSTFGGRDLAAEAARHAEALLEDCAGRWHRGDCPRGQIPLQRAVLQYPGVLSRALSGERWERLRREASTGAPAPSPSEIASPWSFPETENQRAVRMARSLVGQVVAGTPGSETARGWARYAEAFLLAHDRDGWYEAESPGYLPISMNALLLLADHAPDEALSEEARAPRVRELATRQLHLLFATWAQNQVRGYPAGAKARAYVHWALSDGNVPWRAWAWLIAGMGDPKDITFRDWADLAASPRYRVPRAVARLLAGRRTETPYSVRERRRIVPGARVTLDAAFATWLTPDYALGCSEAVEDLRLRVSGSHRIVLTLYPEGEDFAPVYLWSRTRNPRGRGDGEEGGWTGDDLAVCDRDLAVARLGVGHGGGHVYLAPPWAEPEILGAGADVEDQADEVDGADEEERGASGEVAVTRYGNTWLALIAAGGWEVARAVERFPDLYQDRRSYGGARVLVAREQPASVGVMAGRRAEESFEAFRRRAARTRISETDGWIRFEPGGAPETSPEIRFLPGRSATVAGVRLDPRETPRLVGPFLAHTLEGGWRFRYGADLHELAPLPLQKLPDEP
jgi:hypothetical protein